MANSSKYDMYEVKPYILLVCRATNKACILKVDHGGRAVSRSKGSLEVYDKISSHRLSKTGIPSLVLLRDDSQFLDEAPRLRTMPMHGMDLFRP